MDQFDNWTAFIGKIFEIYPTSKIYLKGGAVIGFLLLKQTQDIFVLKSLDLFNDFDLVLENKECCTDYFYNNFGEQNNIFLNGRKFRNGKKNQGKRTHLHIMRSVGNGKLFELSVCDKDTALEIPMTSMRLYITIDNYLAIFDLIKKIHLNSIVKTDMDVLNESEICIPGCDQNGMFTHIVSYDNISEAIKNIIIKVSPNTNCATCLYHLINNPTNISRLFWKNIPKSDNIRLLLKNNVPDWLIDNNSYLKLINDFISELYLIVSKIYQPYEFTINDLTKRINEIEQKLIDCNDVRSRATIRNDMNLLRQDLTETYIELFEKLNNIFRGINIIRWKDNIEIYKRLSTRSALDCIIKIFGFYYDIPVKLSDGSAIITNGKILSENPIWLLIVELSK